MNVSRAGQTYSTDQLWHNATQHSASLGCLTCPEYARCGGMHVAGNVYDCSDMCRCASIEKCDVVCRCRPEHFFERVQEIDGFSLDNVPRAPRIAMPELPKVVTFVDHKYRRQEIFRAQVVALPLYRIIDMAKRRLHITSRKELSERFKVAEDAVLVLTGVDRDSYIERWWDFSNRKELLAELRQIGIDLITSPNYSLLCDVPRTDNLYAIKRIALAWSEMVNAGIATALHVNARTDRDYENWANFIAERDEVQAVAFEFATGCGRSGRIDWHVEQLCGLADKVSRPLHLVVRGGGHKLTALRAHFDSVCLVETDSFNKAMHRREASISREHRLKWTKHATPEGTPVDALLAHNSEIVRAFYERPFNPARTLQLHTLPQLIRRAANRHDKPAKQGLLDDLFPPDKARPVTPDRHRMIPTTKP